MSDRTWGNTVDDSRPRNTRTAATFDEDVNNLHVRCALRFNPSHGIVSLKYGVCLCIMMGEAASGVRCGAVLNQHTYIHSILYGTQTSLQQCRFSTG